jgi:hypothetical protein
VPLKTLETLRQKKREDMPTHNDFGFPPHGQMSRFALQYTLEGEFNEAMKQKFCQINEAMKQKFCQITTEYFASFCTEILSRHNRVFRFLATKQKFRQITTEYFASLQVRSTKDEVRSMIQRSDEITKQ